MLGPIFMKIEYRRVTHVTVAVPAGEHERVKAFYGGILGLEEVTPPAAVDGAYDILWFQWLDVLLHIDFTPPWFRPAENRHLALEIKDIAKVRNYLEKQGAEIREAVVIPDRVRFYVLDPFGNYFEFIEMKHA
jgi:catechol 2,3-dioxygenase-like lactoylglutathione lyase family enzyme